jgi:hypothetical protein
LETKGILIVKNFALSFGCISSTWISRPFVSLFLAEFVVCVGDNRNACRVLEEELKERGFSNTQQIWYVDIKMCLKEIGWDAGDWTHWAWERNQCQTFVKTRMNLWFPYHAGTLLTH